MIEQINSFPDFLWSTFEEKKHANCFKCYKQINYGETHIFSFLGCYMICPPETPRDKELYICFCDECYEEMNGNTMPFFNSKGYHL